MPHVAYDICSCSCGDALSFRMPKAFPGASPYTAYKKRVRSSLSHVMACVSHHLSECTRVSKSQWLNQEHVCVSCSIETSHSLTAVRLRFYPQLPSQTSATHVFLHPCDGASFRRGTSKSLAAVSLVHCQTLHDCSLVLRAMLRKQRRTA